MDVRRQAADLWLKVLRYPGTFAQLKAFSDLGLFDLKPVRVDERDVVPRHLFHALFEPQVKFDQVKDVCVIRVVAAGKQDGKAAQVVVEIMDYYDDATGFTAMQRLTGWHLSIVAAMMAQGEVAIEVLHRWSLPCGAMPLYAKRGSADLRSRKAGSNALRALISSC